MWRTKRELNQKTLRTHADTVSSQIARITTLTCSLCSLHKEHSRRIVSTCFNPSCFRVSTCFSCFNKSLFRAHSQSRQGLHQCLNLPTVATYGVITPDMTKQHFYNSPAHSTRSSTITLLEQKSTPQTFLDRFMMIYASGIVNPKDSYIACSFTAHDLSDLKTSCVESTGIGIK